ncbi:hypothetical protein GQ457_14G011090 [Hibiscus cannabinus]
MRYDKSKVECYSCQKLGHFSWECQNEGSNEERVNLIEDQQDVEEPTLLLALKNEENNDASTWYLDNGASNHINQYANLIAKVSMSKNRMFVLNLKTINAKCLKASMKNEAWCWHMRFGHLNFGALKMLGEKKKCPDHRNKMALQNGKNMTILNMARSMLKAKNMPKEFWAEVVSCDVYLSNRSPTKNVDNVTPQEAWSGRKPSVRHIRVFGSIAYAHVPDQGRLKLDNRISKYVFIGDESNSNGYKLFSPSNGRIVISRDVEFDEQASWNWEAQEEQSYDFFPYFVEEQDVTPSQVVDRPQNMTHPPSPAPIHEETSEESSSSGESSSERPPKFKSVRDLYRSTEAINDLCCLFVDSEPLNFDDAEKDERWKLAMDEEIKSIEKNNTWVLSELPKGYKQNHVIDYDEVFAPVARIETIRLIIALAAQKKWKIHQLDVKSAFLNGFVELGSTTEMDRQVVEKINFWVKMVKAIKRSTQ